ncbi:N-acetyltransferase 9 [Podila horticola]|nr:N-acetyltransferase 9 [Podila horticola]
MRANERTALVGEKCLLVPYLKRHVDHYNKWMQSPELLEMTASEPLTLTEEYEMQESWHLDEESKERIWIEMVGDVNLFFNDHDDPHSAEIEIMIAEPDYRRKGVGLEAIRMMITYAHQSLGTKRITAKISTDNKGSIQLFLTQLGFVQISFSQIFEEVTLEKVLSGISPPDTASTEGETNPGQDMLQVRFETLELDLKDLDL